LSALLSFLFFKLYIFIIEYFYIIYYYFKSIIKFDNKLENSINKEIKFKKFINIIFYIKKLVFNGYYFNEIYNYFLFLNKKLSYILFKNLDRGVIEYIGHLSIVNNLNKILHFFSKRHKGRIDYIVFVMVLSVLIISFVLLL